MAASTMADSTSALGVRRFGGASIDPWYDLGFAGVSQAPGARAARVPTVLVAWRGALALCR